MSLKSPPCVEGGIFPSLSCFLCASVYCWPFTLRSFNIIFSNLFNPFKSFAFLLIDQLPHLILHFNIISDLAHTICLFTFFQSIKLLFNTVTLYIMAVQAQYPSNVLLLNRFAFSLSLSLSLSLSSFSS